MPQVAIASLESISRYSQSRRLPEKPAKMDWKAFEEKNWKERLHLNADGHVCIPPICFKRSLQTAAAFLREKIKGKGSSEYGKHFKAGVLVDQPLVLPETADTIETEWLDLGPQGKPGTMGVWKCMPFVEHWAGEVTYYILDDTIPQETFERHLIEAGSFIGIGRFRPEKGGYYGRYKVNGIVWS